MRLSDYDGLGMTLRQKLKLMITGTRLYGAYVLLCGGCVMQNITVHNGQVELDGTRRGWIKGNLFIHTDMKEVVVPSQADSIRELFALQADDPALD